MHVSLQGLKTHFYLFIWKTNPLWKRWASKWQASMRLWKLAVCLSAFVSVGLWVSVCVCVCPRVICWWEGLASLYQFTVSCGLVVNPVASDTYCLWDEFSIQPKETKLFPLWDALIVGKTRIPPSLHQMHGGPPQPGFLCRWKVWQWSFLLLKCREKAQKFCTSMNLFEGFWPSHIAKTLSAFAVMTIEQNLKEKSRNPGLEKQWQFKNGNCIGALFSYRAVWQEHQAPLCHRHNGKLV